MNINTTMRKDFIMTGVKLFRKVTQGKNKKPQQMLRHTFFSREKLFKRGISVHNGAFSIHWASIHFLT